MNFSKIENYTVKKYKSQIAPKNALDLRRKIYKDEMHYLTDDTLENDWDKLGYHYVLEHKESKHAIAYGHVYKAEEGEFAENSGANPENLTDGIYITRIMVDPDHRGKSLIKLMLYVTSCQGRIWGRKRMFCYYAEGEKPTSRVLNYENIPELNERSVVGIKNEKHIFKPGTQRLDIAINNSWNHMPKELQDFCQKDGVFESQAVEIALNRKDAFFQNPFFSTISNETLAKHHYIWTISNFHQFVRFTTRILGRAVALSEDSQLRKHFIHHLGGEIDHEVQLETDLKTLSADVDYVKNRMPPSIPVQKFMCIQESFLAFRNDPITFISVPFSIEGFTAHLPNDFLPNLEKNIASWGIRVPKKATTFIRAHVVSDGGDDGHWENNKKAIRQFIKTEQQIEKFITGIHMTFDTMEEIYSDFVSEKKFAEKNTKQLKQKRVA